MYLPRGCLTLYTLRDTIIPPCAELRFSPRENGLTRLPAVVTAENERCPGCLAHAVRGVFYSVVVNRRQPNLHIYQAYRGGGVLMYSLL